MSYPSDFDPDEPIVRVLRTPHFVRDGKVRAAAFRPQSGQDRVSVIRWRHRERPESALKARFQAIGNSGKNFYCGVGTFHATECEPVEVILEDARDEYVGHAHIVYPFAFLPNEPLEGNDFERQTEIAQHLVSLCTYVEDPDPDSGEWTIQHALLPI